MAAAKMKIVPIENLNQHASKTIGEVLGIRFTELTSDMLKAEMPVDRRTHQPFGILHGGASVVLAETIGSVGANLALNSEESMCVGLEINANHINSIHSGTVVGVGRPIHVGRSTQVWDIQIREKDTERLICVSRLTLAVVPKKKN